MDEFIRYLRPGMKFQRQVKSSGRKWKVRDDLAEQNELYQHIDQF